MAIYKRIVLKISGESLAGDKASGSILDISILNDYAKVIKELVNERLIKVEPYFINGRQSGNKITYISEPRIKTGKELTLDLLYDITNPYKFKDWDWGEFKLYQDLDLEERINQFEILKEHKKELRKRRIFEVK